MLHSQSSRKECSPGCHSCRCLMPLHGTLHDIRTKGALQSQTVLKRVPSPTRKDPGDLHVHLVAVSTDCHILSLVQHWQAAVRPLRPQDRPSADPSGTQHIARSQFLHCQHEVVLIVIRHHQVRLTWRQNEREILLHVVNKSRRDKIRLEQG